MTVLALISQYETKCSTHYFMFGYRVPLLIPCGFRLSLLGLSDLALSALQCFDRSALCLQSCVMIVINPEVIRN